MSDSQPQKTHRIVEAARQARAKAAADGVPFARSLGDRAGLTFGVAPIRNRLAAHDLGTSRVIAVAVTAALEALAVEQVLKTASDLSLNGRVGASALKRAASVSRQVHQLAPLSSNVRVDAFSLSEWKDYSKKLQRRIALAKNKAASKDKEQEQQPQPKAKKASSSSSK